MSTDNQDPTRIAKKPTDWTVATLYEYFSNMLKEQDRRYEERYQSSQTALNAAFVAQKEAVAVAVTSAEKAVTAALSASKEAVLKAELANEKRFEGVNEFRATLADQQRTLMPRAEAEMFQAATNEKIDALVSRLDRIEGRGAGIKDFIGWIVAAIAVLAFILTWRTGTP